MNSSDSASLKLIADASGAFFGAFFAFLFGLITYYWTKWVERQNKDYDGMVKLEGVLNEHLNIFAGNNYLISGSIATLKAGAMTYNILRKYRIVEDLELSFLDLNLINKYFDYEHSVDALNNDFEVANKACDILRQVSLDGKAPDAAIKHNAQILIGQLTALNKMASITDDETKASLCLVRIKIGKDKPGLLGIRRLFWKPYAPTKHELTEEMKKLEKEIAETKDASSKTISRSQSK